MTIVSILSSSFHIQVTNLDSKYVVINFQIPLQSASDCSTRFTPSIRKLARFQRTLRHRTCSIPPPVLRHRRVPRSHLPCMLQYCFLFLFSSHFLSCFIFL